MRLALTAMALLVLILLATIALRTALVASQQVTVEPPEPLPLDHQQVAERLAAAIRYKTISYQSGAGAAKVEFSRLHEHLEQAFPRVHKRLSREIVSDYSLLYTWKASSEDQQPIILLAHMDVVPVVTGAADDWTYPPFAGAIAEDFVWGRGSMDMKLAMTGSLEAIERLLAEGFEPRRTVYLAFGHDEEIGGENGAGRIAALLKQRGVRAAFTLDEGSAIVSGVVPGVTPPVALVGLAEKGYLTLELTATGEGGHSSKPRHLTAIGKLARAIHRLETNLMPATLRAPASQIFHYLASEMPLGMRAVVANRWLLEPLLLSRLERAPATNAIIRTTTAPTLVEKIGVKENVVPREATGLVNFRILPGDTVEGVIGHVVRTIDDASVAVRAIGQSREASPVSDADSLEFEVLHRTIRQVFPDVVVAPSLVIGGTDSKHFVDLTENSFRFIPMRLGRDDLNRIHGNDERISVENYADIVRFYVQLLRNTTAN